MPIPPWEQAAWLHLRTARAVYHRLHGRAVVSHQSALLLYGVRVSELDLRRVHVTRLLGAGRSDRAVCPHAARPSVDVVCEMDGVRATPAARAVEFGDGRAESVGESWLRVALADFGLPAPLPQAEIRDERGVLVARVDFLFEQYGVIVEFDGAVKYGERGRAAPPPGRRSVRAGGGLCDR